MYNRVSIKKGFHYLKLHIFINIFLEFLFILFNFLLIYLKIEDCSNDRCGKLFISDRSIFQFE